MVQIHCHQCGGFIGEPDTVSHRRPSGTILLAAPHSGLCGCTPSVVYGPPQKAGAALIIPGGSPGGS